MSLKYQKSLEKGGSKMFVNVGESVKVEDLIRGIIVQSGNDACIVVAEAISGSEELFAEELNLLGQEIGLKIQILPILLGGLTQNI